MNSASTTLPDSIFDIQLSKILQQHILSFTKRTKPSQAKQQLLNLIVEGADELSTLFTEHRSMVIKNYYSEAIYKSGYLGYFLPINFSKMTRVLELLNLKFETSETGKPLSILDLGCGPGSASLAFLSWAEKKNIDCGQVHLIDRSRKILLDARHLIEKRFPGIKVQNQSSHLAEFKLKRSYDVVLINHVLNEFSTTSQQRLIQYLIKTQAPNSVIIAVEPGTRKNTRDLMQVRDKVAHEPKAKILGPCLHDNDCPMLLAERNDWCHFTHSWEAPSFVQKVAKIIGNNISELKFSYLAFSIKTEAALKAEASTIEKDPNKNLALVVSNALDTRDKIEYLLCNNLGLIRLSCKKNQLSPKNQAYQEIKRGDLVDLGKESKAFIHIRKNHSIGYSKNSKCYKIILT